MPRVEWGEEANGEGSNAVPFLVSGQRYGVPTSRGVGAHRAKSAASRAWTRRPRDGDVFSRENEPQRAQADLVANHRQNLDLVFPGIGKSSDALEGTDPRHRSTPTWVTELTHTRTGKCRTRFVRYDNQLIINVAAKSDSGREFTSASISVHRYISTGT